MSVSQGSSAREGRPGCGDERRLKKTKTPGVFRRVDAKGKTIGYVCVFRAGGRQRKRSARSYEEAKRIKRESETDRDRGELEERSTITFLRYLDEWVERYRGQGRRGFREGTREEYRRLIRIYAHRHFPAKLKLVDVTTYRLARFVDWLADPEAQGKSLGERTVANAVMPLRAALGTARREGLIRHNPAHGLALPPRNEPSGEEIKVFSPGQLAPTSTFSPGCSRRTSSGATGRSPSGCGFRTRSSSAPWRGGRRRTCIRRIGVRSTFLTSRSSPSMRCASSHRRSSAP